MEETKQPIGQTIELARPIETDSIAKFNQMLSDVISKYGQFEWDNSIIAQADMKYLYETNPSYAGTANIDSTQEVLAFFKKQIKDGKPIITCTRGGQRNGKSYFTLTLADIATRIIKSKTTIIFSGLSSIKELKDDESYIIDENLEIWRPDKKTSATEVKDISKIVNDRPINIHTSRPGMSTKYDYEFEPIAFSIRPEGWVKAIVYKNGNPIGRICLPHPKFLLGEIVINIYEKEKEEFLEKLIGREIPKVENVGTFKAKIFSVKKISKSKKHAGKTYEYGALTLQTPKLSQYAGKHVLMTLRVIQDEPKTEKTEDITGSADAKVMPETTQIETPIEKQELTKMVPSSQDAKREVICEQCKHWQFGHADYSCMKFQGDNGQNCVDMNFESFEQETRPTEETGKQIPRPDADAVKSGDDKSLSGGTPTGGQPEVRPKDDVGGTSPPGAANQQSCESCPHNKDETGADGYDCKNCEGKKKYEEDKRQKEILRQLNEPGVMPRILKDMKEKEDEMIRSLHDNSTNVVINSVGSPMAGMSYSNVIIPTGLKQSMTPEEKAETKKDIMRLLSKGKFSDRDEAVTKITERLSAERGIDIDAKIVESLLP